jgi:predicted nuclease of predicted toxin-antitoxin system
MPRVRGGSRTPPRERQREVKLLLDENLSFRLIEPLAVAFPDSQHVDTVGLHSQSDAAIWEFARDNDFVIVSKDDDFRQLALLRGAPPKVIWVSIGNAGTEEVLSLCLTIGVPRSRHLSRIRRRAFSSLSRAEQSGHGLVANRPRSGGLFKSHGVRYQSRMNAVLKAYVEAHR